MTRPSLTSSQPHYPSTAYGAVMTRYKITYTNAKEEEVEADFYKDEKSFIDFYVENSDPLVPAGRVLRLRANAVRRIETLD